MAIHEVTDGGVRLYTKIGGFAGSSTRTELAAGIIAVCAHGPVHIGSDGEVFVNGAKRLISIINDQGSALPNWKLISDGDLWEHFYNAANAKGTRAIELGG